MKRIKYKLSILSKDFFGFAVICLILYNIIILYLNSLKMASRNDILFTAVVGSSEITVTLSRVHDQNVDIFIDNYYKGCVVKYYNGWMVRFNSNEWSMDDQDAILDRLEIPIEDRTYTNFENFKKKTDR